MIGTAMLTTIDRAKRMSGGNPFEEDEQLELLLMAASSVIETYCNRSFGRNTYTERLSGTPDNSVRVRNYPVSSIESIEYGGRLLMDYDLDSSSGTLYRFSWPRGERSITVTYTAGYVLPGDDNGDDTDPRLPVAIEQACVLLAKTLGREPGIGSERVGDISVTYVTDGDRLPGVVKALLAPYRNIPV